MSIQQNNENIEPRVTEKVTQQTTKSFYNNKETQNPVQNSSKMGFSYLMRRKTPLSDG